MRQMMPSAPSEMDDEKLSIGHNTVPETLISAGIFEVDKVQADDTQALKSSRIARRISSLLVRLGIETHGITPIPPEGRTDTRLYQMFFVWFSGNMNVLTMTVATTGPAFYGLGLKDSLLTILVVDTISCAFPAFFAVFGPKMGTRAMVQSRFSWGYYGAIIPSVLNVLSMQGYLILNCIVAGQVLASASTHLDASLGIVIIALISLMVTFCGYRILHWYEAVIWIPNVVAFIIILGVGGKQVMNAPDSGPAPATPAMIFTFAGTLAASVVSWASISPDYGIYHSHKASTLRIFAYTYLGFFVSSVPAHMIGASFTAAALYVPAWNAGFNDGNDVGGLLKAVLAPTGGFGKFLLVVLSLSAPSACAPTMYTVCTSFMTVSPFFARIPRSALAVVSTAIAIPVGIVGAEHFYTTFTNIIAIIGYWAAPFCAIVLTEHFVFRAHKWSSYDVLQAWNVPDHQNLPPGYAAVFTFCVAIGLVVLCMQQAWWTGPVARAGAGDLGMLVGFVGGVMVYTCARWAEKKWIS